MGAESSRNSQAESFASSAMDSQDDTRADAFVCYSRKDGTFASSLVEEIRAQGKRVVFDVDGIRGGEAWRRKLGNLVEHADNVIVLISADSLSSQYCRWELDYANTLNKRLIPVLVRSADLAEVPESVQAIQWIDATGTADTSQIAGFVVTAIEEDQSWAEYHTRLGLRAAAWKEGEGAVLSRSELKTAESMVLRYEGRRPAVTELQSALLVGSRRAVQRDMSWLAGGLIFVAALAGFGISSWLNQLEERGQRLFNQATNAFRAADVPGALVPLGQLAFPDRLTSVALHMVTPTWVRSASNAYRFWEPRLVPLSEVVSKASVPSLIYLNDQPSVMLATGGLHLLTPQGYFQLVQTAMPTLLVYADANGVSAHDPNTFDRVLSVPADERSHVMGIYQLKAPDLLVAVSERRIVNNDEDVPDSVFHDLYVIYQAPEGVPRVVCVDEFSAAEGAAGCHDAKHLGPSGLAAAVIPIHENYRLRAIHTAGGAALVSSDIDCNLDECEGKPASISLTLKLDKGTLSVSGGPGRESHPSESQTEVMRTRELDAVRFPRIREEAEIWKSTVAPTTTRVSHAAPKHLDFSHLSGDDSDQYRSFFQDASEGNWEGVPLDDGGVTVPLPGGGIIWGYTSDGNSWYQITRCRYDHSHVVTECKQIGLTAGPQHVESPDYRFVAQRNCNSGESSVTLVDVAALTRSTVEIPPSLVLGVAFSPSSRRLAVLTDQHEIWLYSTATDTPPRLERKISLPGPVKPTDDPTCQRGQPISFAGDGIIVGIDRGPLMFAVEVETGRVLWGANSAAGASTLLEQASAISVAPTHSYFALSNGKSVQLFDTDTGLALTDTFEPLKRLTPPATEPGERQFDVIELGADGGVTVRWKKYNDACDGQVVTRTAPPPRTSTCQPLELLTGRDAAGQRFGGAALLSALKDEKSCEMRDGQK